MTMCSKVCKDINISQWEQNIRMTYKLWCSDATCIPHGLAQARACKTMSNTALPNFKNPCIIVYKNCHDMGRYNTIGPQPFILTSHPIILTGLQLTNQSLIVIFQKGKKKMTGLSSVRISDHTLTFVHPHMNSSGAQWVRPNVHQGILAMVTLRWIIAWISDINIILGWHMQCDRPLGIYSVIINLFRLPNHCVKEVSAFPSFKCFYNIPYVYSKTQNIGARWQ